MSTIDDKSVEPVASPTVPDNLAQTPGFGQLIETTKDAFVLELRKYFDTSNVKYNGEVPRLEKFAVNVDPQRDPYETAMNVIRQYPDLTEKMPLIGIFQASGRNFKMSISSKVVGNVQNPPQVVGSLTTPTFALADGDYLEITSRPDSITDTVSTLVFSSLMFNDITHATIGEVVEAINFQALYLVATNAAGALAVYTGKRGANTPNQLSVTGGSTNALAVLGFALNQSDSSTAPGKLIYRRYMNSASLQVSMVVMAESDNIRTEVTDLLHEFLTYYLESKGFTLYGRSIFDPTIPDETYQVIIKDSEINISGERDVPRAQDQKDKVFVNQINVPVHIIQYSDRIVADPNTGQALQPYVSPSLVPTTSLPTPS